MKRNLSEILAQLNDCRTWEIPNFEVMSITPMAIWTGI